jgi:methionyl-tRNA formyltransferase
VTLMALDEGLDTGPVYSTRVTALSPNETAGEVFDRLADAGARHLQQWLPAIVARRAVATRQNDDSATHAAKVSPDERRIGLGAPAHAIRGLVHALSPAPGAYAMLEDDRFKVLRVLETDRPGCEPGDLSLHDGRLLMGTGTTALELLEVQPAGKRVMSGRDWAMGRREALGTLT